ncbi:hypothetical protein HF209_30475 [Pseudomonas sp. WS 5096]|uniref:Lipoprotein n=1 Tax=Pseudomonas cremoris TaxID=2724178 RepID=A0ABR6TH20_9PSED|nr:hypothetical protein [Pseudomonas cremoris]MBC2385283.1 hypothetical protein [Pseudomonas cremoris]
MIRKFVRLLTCTAAVALLIGGLQGCAQDDNGTHSGKATGVYSDRPVNDGAKF